MCRAAASYADFMVVTSDNPRGENPYAILKDILAGMDGFDTPFAVIENRRDATKFALEQARAPKSKNHKKNWCLIDSYLIVRSQ